MNNNDLIKLAKVKHESNHIFNAVINSIIKFKKENKVLILIDFAFEQHERKQEFIKKWSYQEPGRGTS